MMRRRRLRIAVALLIGFSSFALALYSAVSQQRRLILLSSEVPAQLAPISADMVPPGAVVPPPSAVLTPAQHRVIADAMWRDPLDDQIFNLLYTDTLRMKSPDDIIGHRAALLAKLGWRFTPAQQNLIIRNAAEQRFPAVIDRADALLRRQKLQPLAYSILQAMESAPQVHDYVVDKLRANPPWRLGYLTMISAQSGQPLLDERVATLETLLGTSHGVSRAEMVPSIGALVGAGRAREAYRLWSRWVGHVPGDLIFDPSFRRASRLFGTTDPSPFEWHFGQGAGITARTTSAGVEIDWDRRGVPAFLSQLVPVEPGYGYDLTVTGTAGGAPLASQLAPVVGCGGFPIAPVTAESVVGGAHYVFAPLPQACDMGQVSIGGAVDSGIGNIDITVTKVRLTRAN